MQNYERYLELGEKEKDEVYEILTRNNREQTSGFSCPIMECPVYVPCNIKECDYNINNGWVKNCVLCYMNRENLQKLTSTEISFLMKIPEEEVLEICNKQMYNIRKKFLIEALSNKNKITYIPDVDVCCVCDHKTNSSIKMDGLTFCSTYCMKQKPLYIFDIEREFGSDINTIMETTLEKFKSIEVLESVLRISKKKIEFIVHKFTQHLSDKFIKLLNSNPEFLNRKERKSILCIKILKRMAMQRRQFGSPSHSMEHFYISFSRKLKTI